MSITRHHMLLQAIALIASMYLSPTQAACIGEAQGAGRVSEIIDARGFRLSDGAEIRLAGIELTPASSPADLRALIEGRDVTLHGDSDMPDRYGRQSAIVMTSAAEAPVQQLLLARGAALASGTLPDRACQLDLLAVESTARRAKRGIWAAPVIKNAAIPGDILAELGRFVVAEGRVLSVREAGSTTYVNFGPRWTRDFAVTISRRMIPAFAAAGIVPKSLERRRIRVRGWVEARGGPRIEARHAGQIEVVGDR